MSALVDALQKGRSPETVPCGGLDGPEAGSRMLLRGGRPVWQTHSSGVLQRSLSRLQECTATGFWNWTACGCLWNDSVRCRRSLSAAAAM